MSKTSVLNLEWTSYPSRDRQMATLVCNYLRYMGFGAIEGSVFNGLFLLNKYNPEVFFIANSVGADINLELLKYAKSRRIKVATLISEGNIDEEKGFVEEMLWGINQDRILYEDIQMQWSENSRNLTYKYFPELKGKVKVSGAVGFDVYKIAEKPDKNSFLEKYNKEEYVKIVGVGCWDFGLFYPEDHRYTANTSELTKNDINRFIRDQDEFNKVLMNIVISNPDILFLLKEHPGCLGGHKASGIEGLQQYENVLILKNEESIGDCINISDFWLVYESTTALEAWLSGKQTCLLNPSGIDFVRDNTHRGSPNYPDAKSLQNAINSFYLTGELPGFINLKNFRNENISKTIQWDDGLNHVRAGNEIIDLIERNEICSRERNSYSHIVKLLKQMIYWNLSTSLSFLNKFRPYARLVKMFNNDELKEFQMRRFEEQLRFYKKNNLQTKDLRKIRCI
jgi:hypothetical protein